MMHPLGDLGDTAVVMAYSGAEVVPGECRGKRPLPACDDCKPPKCPGPRHCGHDLCHGVLDASNDVEVTERRWRQHPRSNVCWRLGPATFGVDIDLRRRGDRDWDHIQERHGEAPPTRTQRTGSGGLHLIYAAAGPFRGKLTDGIDIKSRSGYLLVQPSRHPDGGYYEWIDDRPIAPAPLWLVALVTKPVTVPRRFTPGQTHPGRVQGVLHAVATAQEGTRNNITFWGGCRAIELGFDPNEVIEAAVASGLPRGEAERAVASAARRAS